MFLGYKGQTQKGAKPAYSRAVIYIYDSKSFLKRRMTNIPVQLDLKKQNLNKESQQLNTFVLFVQKCVHRIFKALCWVVREYQRINYFKPMNLIENI